MKMTRSPMHRTLLRPHQPSAVALAAGLLAGSGLAMAQTVTQTGQVVPATPLLLAQAQPAAALGTVVITARRVETRLEDVPQRVEVVDGKDIDKTIQSDLTDLLKKNASVDVIQYPSGLSGIGIRGFRPEFGGINRHTVLLVDGRPVAADNMAMITAGSLERVEVLKGPGSALYGSGAMGGVVNMISRQSRGKLGGQANLTVGQFGAQDVQFRAGGSINASFDFDYAGAWNKTDDFRMGNGDVRPLTGHEYESHSIRGGWDINKDWRLIAKWNEWKGNTGSAGDLLYGTNDQGEKQMSNSDRDLRLTGQLGDHALSAAVFSGTQSSEMTKISSRNAADRPQLPAVNSATDLSFSGWQVQDAWAWSPNNTLIFGVDTQSAKSVSRSYNLALAGAPRKAPGTADNQRLSQGYFAENSWVFNNGNSTIYVGVRRDNIAVESLDTPYRTGFTPSRTDYLATSPSAGFKHLLVAGWHIHATVGKAFVAPDALYVTGNYATPIGGGKIDYTYGNSGIQPERSLTKDLGLEWTTRDASVDVTVFDTKVSNKITTTKAKNGTGGTTTNYANGDGSSSILGLELQGRWAFAEHYKLTFGSTRYFHNWDIVSGNRVDANNIPHIALKLALDVDYGAWAGRLALRHRGMIKDFDYTVAGSPQVEQSAFTVADLSVRYRFNTAQSVALSVENLTGRFYTEKQGYNMPGRFARVSYRHEF
ncbi:MAG: TonB-dependent receptor [Rhodoferax sp.]|nr:TonB-dependent receptor [Rhodoferax sp.]